MTSMVWLLFFVLEWLFVVTAFYTWYVAVKREKIIRELEKR